MEMHLPKRQRPVKQKNRSKKQKKQSKKDTEQKNPCLFCVWRQQKRKSDRKFGGYILQNVEKKDKN